MEQKSGIELIAIERQEQIEKHGRTIEADRIQNADGQLLHAAKMLISNSRVEQEYGCPKGWDSGIYQKMINKGKLKQLVVAGALYMAENTRLGENKYQQDIERIAAEIDRLQSTKL